MNDTNGTSSPVQVDWIETELTRFPAVINAVRSASYGRYKLELMTDFEHKDKVWVCTDEEGLEVLVVIVKRRAVGVHEPGVGVPALDAAGWDVE